MRAPSTTWLPLSSMKLRSTRGPNCEEATRTICSLPLAPTFDQRKTYKTAQLVVQAGIIWKPGPLCDVVALHFEVETDAVQRAEMEAVRSLMR